MDYAQIKTAHHLLLIDPQDETARNTRFLLKLAGYRVTTTRALDEAVNLVSVLGAGGGYPTILLLDNLEFSSSTDELLELLARSFRNNQILLINRHERTASLKASEYQMIPPRHILRTVRAMIIEQPEEGTRLMTKNAMKPENKIDKLQANLRMPDDSSILRKGADHEME